MAAEFGISLEIQALQEVEAWINANANGTKWSVGVQRYLDENQLQYHRHCLTFDDDLVAIKFKYEMAHYILPSIPPQPVTSETPTSFLIKSEHVGEIMAWVIANVTGVDWSISAHYYKVEGDYYQGQLLTIKDDTIASLFKLANSDYLLPYSV